MKKRLKLRKKELSELNGLPEQALTPVGGGASLIQLPTTTLIRTSIASIVRPPTSLLSVPKISISLCW